MPSPQAVSADAAFPDGSALPADAPRQHGAPAPASDGDWPRLARAHAVQSALGDALVRWRATNGLYDAVCRVLVDMAGLRMAWVGRQEHGSGPVRPLAVAGIHRGHTSVLDDARHREDDPASVALKTRAPWVLRDLASLAPGPRWLQEALQRGHACAAAWPIGASGSAGHNGDVLVVFGDTPGQIDAAMERMLTRLAQQLAQSLQLEHLSRQVPALQQALVEARQSAPPATARGGRKRRDREPDDAPPEGVAAQEDLAWLRESARLQLASDAEAQAEGWVLLVARPAADDLTAPLMVTAGHWPLTQGAELAARLYRWAAVRLGAVTPGGPAASWAVRTLCGQAWGASPRDLGSAKVDGPAARVGAAAGWGAACDGGVRLCLVPDGDGLGLLLAQGRGAEAALLLGGEQARWVEAGAVPEGAGRALQAERIWQGLLRLRLSRALQAARQEAASARSLKASILTNVGHEIRTPMNAIAGFAHLIAAEPLSARQEEHLRNLESAGRQLVLMIDDLLDLARLQSGQLQLESEAFWLDGLLDAVAQSHQRRARLKGIRLQVRGAQGRWRVTADRQRLRQVLRHLVDNALKYCAGGEVQVLADILPCEASANGSPPPARGLPGGAGPALRLTVADTGSGMDAGQLERAFKGFEQGDGSHTRGGAGLGVGLTLVQALVARMGGRVRVDSRPEGGTRFELWLPVPLAQAGTDAGANTADALGGTSGGMARHEPPAAAAGLDREGRAATGPLDGQSPVASGAPSRAQAPRPAPASEKASEKASAARSCASGHAQASGLPPSSTRRPLAIAVPPPARSGVVAPLPWQGRAGLVGLVPPACADPSALPPEVARPCGSGDDEPIDREEAWLQRLAAVPDLDVVAGLRSVNGARRAYREVIALFVRHHGQDPRRIGELLAEGDQGALGALAHGLAGASATLGAHRLHAAARALERQCAPVRREAPAAGDAGSLPPTAPVPGPIHHTEGPQAQAQAAHALADRLRDLLARLSRALALPPPTGTPKPWRPAPAEGSSPAARSDDRLAALAAAEEAPLRAPRLESRPQLADCAGNGPAAPRQPPPPAASPPAVPGSAPGDWPWLPAAVPWSELRALLEAHDAAAVDWLDTHAPACWAALPEGDAAAAERLEQLLDLVHAFEFTAAARLLTPEAAAAAG